MDRELASVFRPLATPGATYQETGSGYYTPLPAGVIPEATSRVIGVDTLPLLDDELVKMKLTPLGQRATGESRPVEYIALEMNVHQPKLNLLGEGKYCSLFLVLPWLADINLPQLRLLSSGLDCSGLASRRGFTRE